MEVELQGVPLRKGQGLGEKKCLTLEVELPFSWILKMISPRQQVLLVNVPRIDMSRTFVGD